MICNRGCTTDIRCARSRGGKGAIEGVEGVELSDVGSVGSVVEKGDVEGEDGGEYAGGSRSPCGSEEGVSDT